MNRPSLPHAQEAFHGGLRLDSVERLQTTGTEDAILKGTMPTLIIEGPPLSTDRKRKLVSDLTWLVSQTYHWPRERIVVVIHENPDENVARGGTLLADQPPQSPTE